MSVLKKSVEYEVVSFGSEGTAGRAAVPPKAGYWYYYTTLVPKKANTEPTVPVAPISNTSPINDLYVPPTPGVIIIDEDQDIARLDWVTLKYYANYFAPSLVGIMSDIEDDYDKTYDKLPESDQRYIKFQEHWAEYEAETTRVLQAEIDTGTLGRPLSIMGATWGPDAYIAAWDGSGGDRGVTGVWFYAFTGFSPSARPTQKIVK